MDSVISLRWLVVATIVLSLLLILASSATLGRKVADLEYQYLAGLDGVRRIQSWINIRTHANRVFLGLMFLVVAALSLAEAPVIWRAWTFRGLAVVMLGFYATSSIMDWLDERKQVRLLMAEMRTDGSHRSPAPVAPGDHAGGA